MSDSASPTIDLDDLREHLSRHGARSPIVQWMIENHDEFAATLEVTGVRWQKLAEYLAAHGLRTARGGIPSGETARRCWLRARHHVAKQKGAKRRPVTTAAPADPATRPEPKFQFVRFRNEGRGVSAEERRALGDPTAPAPGVDSVPEPRFKPFKLRNEGRGVSAAERRALGDPTAPASDDP